MDDEVIELNQTLPSNSEASNQETSLSSPANPNTINPLLFFLLNSSLNPSINIPQPSKNIKTSLDYLNELKEASKVVDDEKAISALIDINDIFRKNKDKISLIIESKLQLVLKDLLCYIYAKLSDYVEKEQFDIELENTDSNFTTFHLVVDLTEILVVSSKEFASIFHMIGGTKTLLGYFEDSKLMSYLAKSFTNSDPFRAERKMNYCKALASILNTLLYLKNNRHQAFKELKAVQILTKFSNSLNFQNCELILRSHFVLAMLCSRKEIESLSNIDFTILILEKTVQMFAQACQKKTKYNSYQFDLFYDNDMRSFEITSFNSPNTFIIIILSVIEAFLVNDDIKYRMFSTIKNSLLILLIQGDLIEKYLALALLINLSFDDVLNEKIRQHSNTLVLVEQLLTLAQLDESIKTLSLCLKSLLNIKKLFVDYKSKSKTAAIANSRNSLQVSTVDKKILISYHEFNELIAMRIRNELELRGFEAELIQRKIENSFDIEKVIKSIENSECLLVCMSSSYEYEKMCQFEVHYANKLDKVIIPLNVQPKYEPDYWLEAIVEENKEFNIALSSIRNDAALVSKEIQQRTRIKPKPTKLNPDSDVANSRTCQIL